MLAPFRPTQIAALVMALCCHAQAADPAPGQATYLEVFGANPHAPPPAPCPRDQEDCVDSYDLAREDLRRAIVAVLDRMDARQDAEFRLAQRAWVALRQHQCDALFGLPGQGPAQCLEELTRARAAELVQLRVRLPP